LFDSSIFQRAGQAFSPLDSCRVKGGIRLVGSFFRVAHQIDGANALLGKGKITKEKYSKKSTHEVGIPIFIASQNQLRKFVTDWDSRREFSKKVSQM
jgi:hypothetical protein